MKFVKVHNIKKENFNLDKEVWESNKGQKFSLCSCKACIKKANVGAKVEIADEHGGNKSYLVPLCKDCTTSIEDYYVNIRDLLILDETVMSNI